MANDSDGNDDGSGDAGDGVDDVQMLGKILATMMKLGMITTTMIGMMEMRMMRTTRQMKTRMMTMLKRMTVISLS